MVLISCLQVKGEPERIIQIKSLLFAKALAILLGDLLPGGLKAHQARNCVVIQHSCHSHTVCTMEAECGWPTPRSTCGGGAWGAVGTLLPTPHTVRFRKRGERSVSDSTKPEEETSTSHGHKCGRFQKALVLPCSEILAKVSEQTASRKKLLPSQCVENTHSSISFCVCSKFPVVKTLRERYYTIKINTLFSNMHLFLLLYLKYGNTVSFHNYVVVT